MSGANVLLLVRLGFSLSIVFGLMWVAAKVMRGRAGNLRPTRADQLEIIERKPLTKSSSIAIVRIADQTYAVGITETQVTSLGAVELPSAADAVIEVDASPAREALGISMPAVTAPATAPVTVHEAASAAPIDLRSDDAVSPSGRRGVLDLLRDKTVRHIPG